MESSRNRSPRGGTGAERGDCGRDLPRDSQDGQPVGRARESRRRPAGAVVPAPLQSRGDAARIAGPDRAPAPAALALRPSGPPLTRSQSRQQSCFRLHWHHGDAHGHGGRSAYSSARIERRTSLRCWAAITVPRTTGARLSAYRSCAPACISRTACRSSRRRSEGRRPPPDLAQSTTLDNSSAFAPGPASRCSSGRTLRSSPVRRPHGAST